jgi:hypothetical protein
MYKVEFNFCYNYNEKIGVQTMYSYVQTMNLAAVECTEIFTKVSKSFIAG